MMNDSELGEKMIRAAERGDIREVSRILHMNPALVDARDTLRLSETALMKAAGGGYLDIVSLLVRGGADLNECDHTGCTALIYSCMKGRENVVNFLLDQGASAAIRGNGGSTALMLASRYGHLSIVRRLLTHRQQAAKEMVVDVDGMSSAGRTALWSACEQGHAHVARVLLLEGRARWRLGTRHYGMTPSEIARVSGHEACVQLLQWWEQEVVERPYALHKARCLADLCAATAKTVTPPRLPAYLQRAGTSGTAAPLPSVTLVAPFKAAEEEGGAVGGEGRGQAPGGPGQREGRGGEVMFICGRACEEERAGTLEFVVFDLAGDLYQELLEAIRA